jgi:hypothetical protein
MDIDEISARIDYEMLELEERNQSQDQDAGSKGETAAECHKLQDLNVRTPKSPPEAKGWFRLKLYHESGSKSGISSLFYTYVRETEGI